VATGEAAFVLGVALAGAAFGMVWPLLVLIVGEIFGTANVGANYMFFDGFTSAAGTLFLSKLVAGEIYEYHIDANAEDKLTCMGTACFRQTQVIITLLSLTCVGTSLVLQFMSRRVYNRSNLHTM
jgi:MFS family permease